MTNVLFIEVVAEVERIISGKLESLTAQNSDRRSMAPGFGLRAGLLRRLGHRIRANRRYSTAHKTKPGHFCV